MAASYISVPGEATVTAIVVEGDDGSKGRRSEKVAPAGQYCNCSGRTNVRICVVKPRC